MSPFEEAVIKACQEPTLLDALAWICVWENDRAVKQAREHEQWGTCFKLCLSKVMNLYTMKHECPVCAAMIMLRPNSLTFRTHGPPGHRCPAGSKTRAEAARLSPNDLLRKFHIETRRVVQERDHPRIRKL